MNIMRLHELYEFLAFLEDNCELCVQLLKIKASNEPLGGLYLLFEL